MFKKTVLIAMITAGLAGAATPGQDLLFVKQLYADVLGRSPNRLEAAQWVALLENGGARIQVAAAGTASQEYRKLMIDGVYMDYLKRSPAPDELAFWLASLQQGASDDQFRAQLLGSDEFYGRAGATDESFLNELYQDVLGTAIDRSASAYFIQLLSQGTPRPTLALMVLTSIAAEQHKVEQWSLRYLRTNADMNVLAAYATAMKAGATDEQIIGLILGSDAYFSLATHLR